jgi:hypothetical protein
MGSQREDPMSVGQRVVREWAVRSGTSLTDKARATLVVEIAGAIVKDRDLRNERESIARAIWATRPDCQGKPWPLETEQQRRAYSRNPIAACDLCFDYADAVLATI